MAKSTKPTAKKAATPKSPEKSTGKKNKAATPSEPAPMVDTDLAAAAAARSLMARLPSKGASASTPPAHTESSMFKQMKSGMAKPAGQAMSNMLDKHGGPVQKSGHAGFGSGGPQQGKNQVFGADVNRAGVPRRTGGG